MRSSLSIDARTSIRAPDQSLRYSAGARGDGDQDASPSGCTRLWILRDGKPMVVMARLGLSNGHFAKVVEDDLLPRDQLIRG
jgi:hypothetical protein